MPHSAAELFAVVSDVERYSEFLPFCEASRVVRREGPDVFLAELAIGFRLFTERYTSRVVLCEGHAVEATAVRTPGGLFSHLKSMWTFEDLPGGGGCTVRFNLEFEVASPIHAQAMRIFFNQVAHQQVRAFTRRCDELLPKKRVAAPTGHRRPDAGVAGAVAPDAAPPPASGLSRQQEAAVLAAFDRVVQPGQRMGLEQFLVVCHEISEHDAPFSRFRQRVVARAVNREPRVTGAGVFRAALLRGEDSLPRERFASEVFNITLAPRADRLLHALSPGRLADSSPDALERAAAEHVRLQIQVLRVVLPDMAFRMLSAGTRAERGVRTVGILGVMDAVLDEVERKGLQLARELRARAEAEEGREWLAGWVREQRAQMHGMTVPGLAALLQWAVAMDSRADTASLSRLI